MPKPPTVHVNGYEVLVLGESDLAWRVECQNRDCPHKIDVPKSGFSEPQPRGCIDHPPSTWAASSR